MIRVPLYRRGNAIVEHALVDDVDWRLVSDYRWHLKRPRTDQDRRYAATSVGSPSRTLMMHRLVMGLAWGDPREVDHVNRDGLDNRRSNLRVVTRPENRQNLGVRRDSKSGFRGVYWAEEKRKWRARVRWQGSSYSIGYFDDERAAAAAVSQWRAEHMPFAVEVLPS